ncbi:hypothetical protein VC83_05739 [Pseudogymnoascus destructans]|uniref:Uncharacterized protein n=1 Tax=Pseudogymnoascus destructans TaxID=655981 RepID=A0A177A841_9PEZI|nr:uncharacterized protein VC83_05739 [Pseudogymnoascus destructans]OAF57602.1 hypothetical protein VC83_05739 [Pseudogymnoascus destructans]
MPSFNLSTRQIIALFSSAAFLAIVVNSFILFGADGHEEFFMLFFLDKQNQSLISRSSKTGATSTATTMRTLSMTNTPYIGGSSKKTHYGIVTRNRGKHIPNSPALF